MTKRLFAIVLAAILAITMFTFPVAASTNVNAALTSEGTRLKLSYTAGSNVDGCNKVVINYLKGNSLAKTVIYTSWTDLAKSSHDYAVSTGGEYTAQVFWYNGSVQLATYTTTTVRMPITTTGSNMKVIYDDRGITLEFTAQKNVTTYKIEYTYKSGNSIVNGNPYQVRPTIDGNKATCGFNPDCSYSDLITIRIYAAGANGGWATSSIASWTSQSGGGSSSSTTTEGLNVSGNVGAYISNGYLYVTIKDTNYTYYRYAIVTDNSAAPSYQNLGSNKAFYLSVANLYNSGFYVIVEGSNYYNQSQGWYNVGYVSFANNNPGWGDGSVQISFSNGYAVATWSTVYNAAGYIVLCNSASGTSNSYQTPYNYIQLPFTVGESGWSIQVIAQLQDGQTQLVGTASSDGTNTPGITNTEIKNLTVTPINSATTALSWNQYTGAAYYCITYGALNNTNLSESVVYVNFCNIPYGADTAYRATVYAMDNNGNRIAEVGHVYNVPGTAAGGGGSSGSGTKITYTTVVHMYNSYGYADTNSYLELNLPNNFTDDATIPTSVKYYLEAGGDKVLIGEMENYTSNGGAKTPKAAAFDVRKHFEKVFVNLGTIKKDWNRWSFGADKWATIPGAASMSTATQIKLIAEVTLEGWSNSGWNPAYDASAFNSSSGRFGTTLYMQLWHAGSNRIREYCMGDDIAITGSKLWAINMETTVGTDSSNSRKPFMFLSDEAAKDYVDLIWDMTLANRSYIMDAKSVDLVVKLYNGSENGWIGDSTYGTAMYGLYGGTMWLTDSGDYNIKFNEISYRTINAEEIKELRFSISPDILVNSNGVGSGMTGTFRILAQYEIPKEDFYGGNMNAVHYNHWTNNAYLEVTMPAGEVHQIPILPDNSNPSTATGAKITYTTEVPMRNLYGYADMNSYLELNLPNNFTDDATIPTSVKYYLEAGGDKVLIGEMENYTNNGGIKTPKASAFDVSKHFEKVFVNLGTIKKDWNRWSFSADKWATVPIGVFVNTSNSVKLIAEVTLEGWSNSSRNPAYDASAFNSPSGKYGYILYTQLWTAGQNWLKEYGTGDDFAVTGSKAFAMNMSTTVTSDSFETGYCGYTGDGSDGSNLTWKLDKNGTLTISGRGKMADYNYPAQMWWESPITPWGWHDIKNVVIEEGVTSIGSNAFSNETGMVSVTIPSSIISIGDYAFKGCTGLTSVSIPSGVMGIGNQAFMGCTSLTDIYCGLEKAPEGWDTNWQGVQNPNTGKMAKVHWNKTGLDYLPGDVNSDNKLNNQDAIHLLKHVMNPGMYKLNQKGDMNGDGKVNNQDAIYLLKHILNPSLYPLKN